MDELADAAAVEAVLAGETEAFAGLVERWQVPLYRLALRYTASREEAEDLTQEIFLHAFRSLARWRREARFSTWLFALALNLCRSHARKLRPELVALNEELAAAIEMGEGERASVVARVRRALAALPHRYRDVLERFYVRSLDVRATSRALDLPEGTVKARLSRGRKLLGQLLAPREAPRQRR